MVNEIKEGLLSEILIKYIKETKKVEILRLDDNIIVNGIQVLEK